MINLTNNKRNIPRFSIKRRIHTNPQYHRQPFNLYFNKVKRDNSLLNADADFRCQLQPLEYVTESSAQKNIDSSCFHNFNSTSHSFKANTNIRQNISKSRFDNRSQQKHARGHQSSSKQGTPFQLKQHSKNQKKQYMSYSQYEDMLSKGSILPNYFQKAAYRNDQKAQIRLGTSIQSMFPKGKKQNKRKQNIIKLKNQMIEGIESLLQKHKQNHIPWASFEEKKHIKTIISSNLGSLSNHTIREKLQEKWDQQLKCQTINRLILTEESELASDKDTRQISVRDESNILSFKVKAKKDSQNEGVRVLEIESLPNEQHKTKLKRIFTKRERSNLTEENLSRGEEYQFLEQNMVKIGSSFKSKKFVLKHKIEWKV